jgi:hypothetical protein
MGEITLKGFSPSVETTSHLSSGPVPRAHTTLGFRHPEQATTTLVLTRAGPVSKGQGGKQPGECPLSGHEGP